MVHDYILYVGGFLSYLTPPSSSQEQPQMSSSRHVPWKREPALGGYHRPTKRTEYINKYNITRKQIKL